MSNLIRVDFRRRDEVPEEVSREVQRLGRRAATLLAGATGFRVQTCLRDRRYSIASVVSGTTYRLEVTVGAYEDGVKVDVTADVEWLRDQFLATEGTFGGEYARVDVTSVEAAMAWVLDHCHTRPVDRVAEAELARWSKRFVHVPDVNGDSGGLREVPLAQAVRIYGVALGRRASPQAIEADGVPSLDAAEIARAVWLVLPRRTA